MTTNDEEQKEKRRVIAFECLLYLFVKHLETDLLNFEFFHPSPVLWTLSKSSAGSIPFYFQICKN